MNIEQLLYFKTIVQSGGVTKAAQKLNIAQPALTSSMNRLRDEIGFDLFRKVGRNLELTEYGESFFKHTNKILAEYDRALNELNSIAQDKEKILHLAVTGTSFAADFIYQFHQKYPEYKISQKFIHSNDVESEILDDKNDFVLAGNYIEADGITSFKIEDEELFVVIPKGHPLCGEKSINLSYLSNEEFITLPDNFSFCHLTKNLCKQAGFNPKVVMECSPAQIPSMINKGIGITISPKSAIESGHFRSYDIETLSISSPKCIRPITINWATGKNLNKAARAFLKTIQDITKDKDLKI